MDKEKKDPTYQQRCIDCKQYQVDMSFCKHWMKDVHRPWWYNNCIAFKPKSKDKKDCDECSPYDDRICGYCKK